MFATGCMFPIPGNCTVFGDTYVDECYSLGLAARGETRTWNKAKITTRQASEVKWYKNKASFTKVTLVSVHTQESVWMSGSITLPIVYLDT